VSHHWGYVSVIASAVLFGISSTLNKLALQNVSPTLVAGMIYFIGGVFLFIIHFTPLSDRILSMIATPGTEDKISRKDLGVLTLVVACGSVVAPLLLLNGLNQTTAINASLLLNAESLFTVLLARARLRRKNVFHIFLAVDYRKFYCSCPTNQ
jgi:drug/metabolite transporter (DMT)-like permease